jgi:FdhD protein
MRPMSESPPEPASGPAPDPTIKPRSIVRIVVHEAGDERQQVLDPVAVEAAVTLFVNELEVATLLCTPTDVEALGVGFLLGEGVLQRRDQLIDAAYDRGRGILRLKVAEDVDLSPFSGERKGTVTSGCGKGQTYAFVRDVGRMPPVASRRTLAARTVAERVKGFMRMSDTYRDTGGVHSAMFWDGAQVEVFCEDLGRHNAVDKVFGRCLLEGIEAAGGVLFVSGRISSEIALKCARRQVPIVISRNAPTSFSLTLADVLDVTLVGFVRGDRMNVYTHPERIEAEESP